MDLLPFNLDLGKLKINIYGIPNTLFVKYYIYVVTRTNTVRFEKCTGIQMQKFLNE